MLEAAIPGGAIASTGLVAAEASTACASRAVAATCTVSGAAATGFNCGGPDGFGNGNIHALFVFLYHFFRMCKSMLRIFVASSSAYVFIAAAFVGAPVIVPERMSDNTALTSVLHLALCFGTVFAIWTIPM